MFEFVTLTVFGVLALKYDGAQKALSLLLIVLLIIMDAGAYQWL